MKGLLSEIPNTSNTNKSAFFCPNGSGYHFRLPERRPPVAGVLAEMAASIRGRTGGAFP